LSRSNLKEYEVILQRAGLNRISLEDVKKLRVCPRHRFGLGKYWRPSRLCQYPEHKSSPAKVKGRDIINIPLAQEIYDLFGISVPVGSGKNDPISETFTSHLKKLKFFHCVPGSFPRLRIFKIDVSISFTDLLQAVVKNDNMADQTSQLDIS